MLVPASLTILVLLEAFVYILIKRGCNRIPVIAATITYSRLINHFDLEGKREIGAIIKYKYRLQGAEYQGEKPVLKCYDLFPSLSY